METPKVSFRRPLPFRLLLLLAALSMVAAACSSSDSSDTDQSVTTTPEKTTDDPPTTNAESAPETAFATVDLPEGLRPWWESRNRSRAFGGDNYLLAASSDVDTRGEEPGVTLLRLEPSLEWEAVDLLIPASVASADMFMTGSRLVVSHLDQAGEIVVASSEDGTTFEEARLAIPGRYSEAAVWNHTSLFGNLVGAADLNGDVFAIANIGIIWSRPTEIAQQYAMEQDPDAAESIRYAGTIRTSPTDDGDFLFVFEKDDEVVAEVLASDAGIEDGYIEAFRDRDDDTFESQSWLINGSTSTNLDVSPFNGQDGIRIHSLYPVDGGVAAMVTDFNADADGEGANEDGGASAERGRYMSDISAIRAGESAWYLRTMVTLDGILWFAEALVGTPNPTFGALAWSTFNGVPLFVLMFYADEGAEVAVSDDGSNWATADYTTDIDLGGGATVQVIVAGEKTTHIYSSGDGSYEEYNVVYVDGEAFLEPIHESVIPQLSINDVAVRITPTAEEWAAFEAERRAEQSLGLFGDILFGLPTD